MIRELETLAKLKAITKEVFKEIGEQFLAVFVGGPLLLGMIFIHLAPALILLWCVLEILEMKQ